VKPKLNWRQHLQRLSPHGLHWPTVDEGLDTAALISVSLMLLGCRNATTGGSGNNLASVTFTVMQDISCKTKNLVYAIICSNCGEFYVGETKTELRTRMTVHRQQTRHQVKYITYKINEHL
jgi:hypothetical protein